MFKTSQIERCRRIADRTSSGWMSEEYVRHWPVWIECTMVHNLKSTRRSTGNQWCSLRVDVRCSFIRRSRISRAAAFWKRWSGMIADFGRLSCRSQASKEQRVHQLSDEFLSVLPGISNYIYLLSTALCRILSNALEKSRPGHDVKLHPHRVMSRAWR